jgi:hypothetical protein
MKKKKNLSLVCVCVHQENKKPAAEIIFNYRYSLTGRM